MARGRRLCKALCRGVLTDLAARERQWHPGGGKSGEDGLHRADVAEPCGVDLDAVLLYGGRLRGLPGRALCLNL
jgi:hypothetical protein